MKKEFEAYYSRGYAWIFFSFAVMFLIAVVLLSVFWIDDISLIFIIACSMVTVSMILSFAAIIKKDGVAVEVTDNKLILHKKECVEIFLFDIRKILIYDRDGSFDISVKTTHRKYRMHCFIKEQRKKKDQLIKLLRGKGIKVDTFE